MTILFISMAVFLLIGVPIGGAIGGAIVLMNLLEPFTTMEYLTQYMYSGVNPSRCSRCRSLSSAAV